MGAEPSESCPRCGGPFHCGMGDDEPCACSRIALDALTLAALRDRYVSCLCMNCLMQIAREGVSPAPD